MHYLLNTSLKIESHFTGLNMKKALFLNVSFLLIKKLMSNYDVTLLISEDFISRMNSLNSYYRVIDRLYDPFTGKEVSLYCIDVILNRNPKAAHICKKPIYSKEESLVARNFNTKGITEKVFNIPKTMRFDPDINLIRPKNLNTFVKYFQFGYEFYLIKSYEKAKEALINALSFYPHDKRTKSILERIDFLMKNTGVIL